MKVSIALITYIKKRIMSNNKFNIIISQFHPIVKNDEWGRKCFTEWGRGTKSENIRRCA